MSYTKNKNDAGLPAIAVLTIVEEEQVKAEALDEVLESDMPALSDGSIFTTKTGVVGLVTDSIGNPVGGQLVKLYAGARAGGAAVGEATSDEDGGYAIPYNHTGTEQPYTVQVVSPLPISATRVTPDPAVITLGVNGVAFAHFVID